MQTVCPICHTIFRVAATALHDTDGMVQCGVCGMVFNAHAHWIATTAPLAVTGADAAAVSFGAKDPESSEMSAHTDAVREDSVSAGHYDNETNAASIDGGDRPDNPPEQPNALAEPLAEAAGSDETDVQYPDVPEETVSNRNSTDMNETAHTEDGPLQYAPAEAEIEHHIDAADIADHASSVPIASVGSERGPDDYIDFLPVRKESRSALFSAASLILIFLLLLQSVYLYRNRIANDFPQTKSALTSLCRAFGCSIELPRAIEAIKVSSSELIADPAHQNLMKVTFGLENLSSKAIAYPSVSLALINDAGEIVVKRNFDPQSYASRAAIEQGISPHDEISGKLTLKLDRINVSNYKLLLYYP
ncbi:MAG: zinc-ribbon and DUF3426 domain-containing protein [Burkholderiales bacterium]